MRGACRMIVRSDEIERLLGPTGPDINETVVNTSPRPRPCFDAEDGLGGHARFYLDARCDMVAFCNFAIDRVDRGNFPNAACPGRLRLYRFAALELGIIDGLVRSRTGNVPIRRCSKDGRTSGLCRGGRCEN